MAPEAALDRMARSLQAWHRAVGRAGAGGGVLEVGELVGSLVPMAATRSILNAAAAPHGAVLRREALRELGERYAQAGVRVWGVWAHGDDAQAAAALEAEGLVVDSRPAAMALELGALGPAPARPGVTVEQTRDLALLAEPIGAAYGFPPIFLSAGLPGLLEQLDGWLARVDGEPAAGVLVARANEDAGIFMVGTAPPLRRRGAAAAALHHALLQARREGCTTSTLQASAMGRPVYAGMGYQDLGTYLLWERRAMSDHPSAGMRGAG